MGSECEGHSPSQVGFLTTPTMHEPGIESGSVPWQGTILPLDHWCLIFKMFLTYIFSIVLIVVSFSSLSFFLVGGGVPGTDISMYALTVLICIIFVFGN